MPFEVYDPSTVIKSNVSTQPLVSISKSGLIAFNAAVRQQFVGKSKRVRLSFDRERRAIGIEFADGPMSVPICNLNTKAGQINALLFLRKFGALHESTARYPAAQEGGRLVVELESRPSAAIGPAEAETALADDLAPVAAPSGPAITCAHANSPARGEDSPDVGLRMASQEQINRRLIATVIDHEKQPVKPAAPSQSLRSIIADCIQAFEEPFTTTDLLDAVRAVHSEANPGSVLSEFRSRLPDGREPKGDVVVAGLRGKAMLYRRVLPQAATDLQPGEIPWNDPLFKSTVVSALSHPNATRLGRFWVVIHGKGFSVMLAKPNPGAAYVALIEKIEGMGWTGVGSRGGVRDELPPDYTTTPEVSDKEEDE